MLIKTQTDKWKDLWFMKLTRDEKLLFIYLTENCDDAGFFELNFPIITTQLGMDDILIKNTLMAIKKCWIGNKAAPSKANPITKIWITKYLLHQEKLPLNLLNDDAKKIYSIIKTNLEEFNNHPSLTVVIEDVLNNTPAQSTKKRNSNPTRAPKKEYPDIEKFRTYCHSIGQTDEQEIVRLHDYYISCGWKIGKFEKTIIDWEATVRNNFRSSYTKEHNAKQNVKTNSPSSKISTIQDATQKTFERLGVNLNDLSDDTSTDNNK